MFTLLIITLSVIASACGLTSAFFFGVASTVRAIEAGKLDARLAQLGYFKSGSK